MVKFAYCIAKQLIRLQISSPRHSLQADLSFQGRNLEFAATAETSQLNQSNQFSQASLQNAGQAEVGALAEMDLQALNHDWDDVQRAKEGLHYQDV